MKSDKFLACNARNLQSKMKFFELGDAKLFEIKKELFGKKIRTTNPNIFYQLVDLEVKEFRVVGGGAYKRVCPTWTTLVRPYCLEMCNQHGKDEAARIDAMPTVEGIIFRR